MPVVAVGLDEVGGVSCSPGCLAVPLFGAASAAVRLLQLVGREPGRAATAVLFWVLRFSRAVRRCRFKVLVEMLPDVLCVRW